MSKQVAWLIFIGSVICFLVQFSTQQLVSTTEHLHADLIRPAPATPPVWQTADAGDESAY